MPKQNCNKKKGITCTERARSDTSRPSLASLIVERSSCGAESMTAWRRTPCLANLSIFCSCSCFCICSFHDREQKDNFSGPAPSRRRRGGAGAGGDKIKVKKVIITRDTLTHFSKNPLMLRMHRMSS